MKKKIILGIWLLAFLALIISFFFDKRIILAIIPIRNEILSPLMVWASFFGTGFFVLIFTTTLFLWQERKREWIPTMWASVLISLLIVYLIRLFYFRERPDLLLEGVAPKLSSSFPSGHATAVFSTIAVLDREFPKFKWFWLGFACLVAFSRLYIGVHYLSDVIAGALLGSSIGFLFVWLEEKHKIFKVLRKKLKIRK